MFVERKQQVTELLKTVETGDPKRMGVLPEVARLTAGGLKG